LLKYVTLAVISLFTSPAWTFYIMLSSNSQLVLFCQFGCSFCVWQIRPDCHSYHYIFQNTLQCYSDHKLFSAVISDNWSKIGTTGTNEVAQLILSVLTIENDFDLGSLEKETLFD